MDQAVQAYIDAIDPAHRPLFDRLHLLVLQTCPDVTVTLSYRMPTYRVGRRRLYLGAWRHGLSVYGWSGDGDGGFTARHPELRYGRGTVRLRPPAAAGITDDEFRALFRAALGG